MNSIRLNLLVLLAGLQLTQAATPAPLTDADCEQFGRDIQTHFAAHDPGFYVDAFDPGAIFDRAFPKDNNAQDDLYDLKLGTGKGFRESFRQSCQQISAMKFLRVRQSNGERRVLMRLVTTDMALNYQELILERSPAGKIRIADAFVYASGEKLSDTFRRMLIPIVAEKHKSLIERLLGGRSDIVDSAPQWLALVKASAAGNHRQVLALYDKLPKSVQDDKAFMIYRLKAAQNIDQTVYLDTMDRWRRLYPHDPSIDLISIDAFILRKDFRKGLECVDRLEKSVGGDSFLDFERGLIFKMMNDVPRAETACARAAAVEPEIEPMQFFLLALLVDEHKYAEGVNILSRVEARGNQPHAKLIRMVEGSAGTQGFVKSAEYRKWHDATADVVAASQGAFKVQSVMIAGARSSATINGKFCMVNDKVGDYTVSAIAQDAVTLLSPSGEKKILEVGR
jgi:hypothetical protein